MYLRHLHVQNVKLLRDVKIDFVGAGGRPRMWTVFVGENRSCKTTLLQTIAAAASGVDQAIHLTTDVVSSWPDLRRPDALLSVTAEWGDGPRARLAGAARALPAHAVTVIGASGGAIARARRQHDAAHARCQERAGSWGGGAWLR